MRKEDIKERILLKNNNHLYRVLYLEEYRVFVIDCQKQIMPIWKTYEDFIDYVKADEPVIEEPDAHYKKIAYQRYHMITDIIPVITDISTRTQEIKKAAKKNHITEQTIRGYLCKYLSTMNIFCLAPKKNKKRPLSKDEKNMRKALNRWYYTTKKRTMKHCYLLMLREFYCDEKGQLPEFYPSYYQFRYFYRKYNKKQTEYISRNGLSYYQRNQRPLVGNKVQSFAPTVGMGMLDSTICDIYLVNENRQLIGRPILVLCVDAYSGMICGYSLTWEGGMYSLRELMLNVITDKVKHCETFGISIQEEQWPCNELPLKLVTDQGAEYKSDNFSQIVDLGVEIINLKSYRADEKGPVEQCFHAIQDYFKPILKGKGVIEPDFMERGAHDYRKDACLTMKDFEKVIIHCIIFYNSSRILKNFPFTEDMLTAKVRPIPCYIWEWGYKQLGAEIISVKKEELIHVLLPRTTGVFKRTGLYVNKLHYHNDAYKELYLKGGQCEVAYDMDSIDHVWIIENGEYICFNLIENHFKGKNLQMVETMKEEQKYLVQKEKQSKLQAEIDLISSIKTITDLSLKEKVSLKGLQKNKEKEKKATHKNHLKEAKK